MLDLYIQGSLIVVIHKCLIGIVLILLLLLRHLLFLALVEASVECHIRIFALNHLLLLLFLFLNRLLKVRCVTTL